MVLKLLAGTKFGENGQKLRILRNLIPAKFNTFRVVRASQHLNFSQRSGIQQLQSMQDLGRLTELGNNR